MRTSTLGTRGFYRVRWEFSAEAASAGHYKDLTETGNRARKVSGTQGSVHLACEARNKSALHRLGNTGRGTLGKDQGQEIQPLRPETVTCFVTVPWN